MGKEVRWTQESIETFNKIIEYLEAKWASRDVENFVNSTAVVVKFISENPKMFRKTNKKNIREALVTPHNLMIYKITADKIDIITFWDTRQNPKKKKHK
ncbi:MAG TPA: type II toxin-antitoxin system RelE/ParE family toxin [Bacteroidia bacterium]|jgi:plasmid stabilization system protein ParE|nr:type II toxin-antitoxin system RelE/ParE family toxin [Bacteroidia bacterium]